MLSLLSSCLSLHGGYCVQLASSGLAAPVPGLEFLNLPENGSLGDLIRGLYVWGIGIVGFAAFVGLVIGGVYYLTAGDSTSRAGEGKKWITNALWGLGLALCSYILVYTINPALTNLDQGKLPVITNLDQGKLPVITGEISGGGPGTGTVAEGGTCRVSSSLLCATGTCYRDTVNCKPAQGDKNGICQASCTPAPPGTATCTITADCGSPDLVCLIATKDTTGKITACRSAAGGQTGACMKPNCK